MNFRWISVMALLALSLAAVACSDSGEESERTRGGKTDGFASGSCVGDGVDFCGGRAEDGDCFCDSQCEATGDCCADKESVCGGPTGTCEDGGGECIALMPGACPDGEIGDGDQFSCGGGLGVFCCLPASEPSNDCEVAGGECVALVPDACPDGELGDVSEFSCGGQVGITCCLPTTASP